MKLTNNKEIRKELEEVKRIQEVKMLVTDFLENNVSDNSLAKKYKMNSATVGRRLTDKARILQVFADKGEEIYNYIIKYRELKAKEEELKITEQIKILVKLFLETNKQDLELATLTNIPSTTVGRRLTDETRITDIFGADVYKKIKEKRQQNLQDAKIKGGINSQLANVTLKDEVGRFDGSTKLRLDIFKEDISETQLLGHLILYFRVKLQSLVNIFNCNEKMLKDLHKNFGDNAINYLFQYDNTNELIAVDELISFYKKLIPVRNNKELFNKVMSEIDDTKIKRILSNKLINDQNVYDVLKFQIKYALSNEYIISLFNISLEEYENLIKDILEKDPILYSNYTNLLNYYTKRNSEKRNV